MKDYRGTRQVAVGGEGANLGLTDDLAEAVAFAELLVVPLPSTTHESLAPEMAPLLRDGQVVFLPPGTFGSYLFAKAMHDAGNRADVAFAETGTLPYLARKHGAAEVVISGYATRLPTGVFPSRLTEPAFALLRQAYPSVEPIEDGLAGALMNAGPIIHPPLILMNAGPLEHFETWDIHNEGTQPAIRRVTTALDAERMALREALGYPAPHFPLPTTTTPPRAMSGCTAVAPTASSPTVATGARTSTCSATATCSKTPAWACPSWSRSAAGPACRCPSPRAC